MTGDSHVSGKYSTWTRSELIARLSGLEQVPVATGAETTHPDHATISTVEFPDPITQITDALPVLISYVDAEQRYRMCNKTYEDWWGCDRSTILGHKVEDVLGDAVYQKFRPLIERVLAGETVISEAIVDLTNKGRRFTHTIYIPDLTETASVRGFFVLVTDITDFKESETALREARDDLEQRVLEGTSELQGAYEALQQETGEREQTALALVHSEERYRSILDNMEDTYYCTDGDGRIELVSRSGVRLLGFPMEEIVGRRLADLYVASDGRERFLKALQESGGQLTDYRAALRRKDGGEVWVSTNARFRLSPEGNIIGVEGTTRDITQQLHAEKQLRQAQKMEAIGQLTGGVAHEFNNLLLVILGNLERAMSGVLSDEVRTVLSSATRGALRGAELTTKLLAFSHKQDLKLERVEIDNLVSGMRDMLQRTLGETFVIDADVGRGVAPIMADAGQIESVLLNLVINARDAMPQGGKITITTRNKRLEAGDLAAHPGAEAGDFVLLDVTDTGSGMTPEVAERVFEPFFTTKDVGEGTGLGLSMVHGFVEQSGGFVEIDSNVGKGTSIRIYFPCTAEVPDEAKPVEGQSSAVSEVSGTVLVVEDDPDVRDLVVQLLSNLGCEILEAADGAEALAHIDGGAHIDLLFTDVVLPNGMSGTEIAEAANRRIPDVKVVLTSGYPKRDDNTRAIDAKGSWFLRKPYRVGELAEILATALKA